MGTVKSNENIIKDISIVIQSIDNVLVNLNRYFEINDAFKDKNEIIKKAPILFTQAFDNLKYKIIVLAMKLFEETNEQIGLERIINELKTFKEYHVSLKNLINKSRKMLKKVLPKGYLSKTKPDKKEDEEIIFSPHLLKYENIDFYDLKKNLISIYDILNNIKEKCK